MSSFRIRDARGGDREAVGALWLELMAYHRALDPRFTIAPDGEQRYIRHAVDMMRSRDGRVLVAESIDGGRVVGYIMGEIQVRPPIALPGRYGFISDICVEAAWRRQGVGRALFEEMYRWFVARKASAIELYIAVANPAATRFWEAMGLSPFLTLLHRDLT